MIDNDKKQQKAEQKERVRQRMRVKVDAENYEYIPAKEQVDYYSTDVHQRVAIYVRVSTDDVRQTTSFELQQKYYKRRGHCLANDTALERDRSLRRLFPTEAES